MHFYPNNMTVIQEWYITNNYNQLYGTKYGEISITDYIPKCQEYNFICEPDREEVLQAEKNNDMEIIILKRIFTMLHANGIEDESILVEVDY